MKRIFVLLFLLSFIFGTGHLWYLAKDGFNINRLLYPLQTKEVDSSEEEHIASLLHGSYHYLGKGRQCYVFSSEDQRYVIKIPRFDRYNLPFRWKVMPSFFNSIKKSIFDERQSRLRFTMQSFEIAATDLKDLTAVLYLHFHHTQKLPTDFVFNDRVHRSYHIDLNRMPFILQEKKEIMMPLCMNALRNDREKAKSMFLAFLNIIDERARKGIFNRDPSFLKNFGWDGQKSIQIDIGSFWKRRDIPTKEIYSSSLRDGLVRFRDWLSETDPEMLVWFDQQVKEKLQF